MRFLRLDLRSYGPFRNCPPIGLDGGSRGLHLIQGSNEAGKSTTLRAIRALLFGFPRSTGDARGGDYDALRLGATIRDESGVELSFLRRKKDIKPLWTPDDAESISRDALLPFLGDLDEGRFVDFFSMDHAELVRGGALIVGGGGRLGEMLFAAGSGLARVEDVRKGLDGEMRALFLPGGSNPPINAALREVIEARNLAERAMVQTESWVDFDAQLARAEARRGAVAAEIREAEADRRRLERLRDALPVLARRDEKARELADRSGVPVLSEGFAGRRIRASTGLEAAHRAADAAARSLEATDAELARLGPRDPILDEADAVRRAREDLVLYRRAVEGRPAALAKLARVEADALAGLADVRPGLGLDALAGLRVPAPLRDRVRALVRDRAGLEARVESARLDRDRLALDAPPGLADAPAALDGDAPRLADALARAIARAVAPGDLEAQLAEGRRALALAGRKAEISLRALPLWSGTLADLEALAAPSAATIDRFELEHRGADEAARQAERSAADAAARLAAIDLEIDREALADAPPTEADLAHRRTARDDAWRAVRRAWIDAEPPPEADGDPAALAGRFEALARAADDAADRLRREAERAAAHHQRTLSRRDAAERAAALAEGLDRARVAHEAGRADWIGIWRAIGIEPLTPREMHAWTFQDRAGLVRQAQGLRDLRADLDARLGRIEPIREELGRHLEALGEPAVDPSESLAALLGRARGAVDRVAFAGRIAGAGAALERAEGAVLAWRDRWAAAIGPLGLGADASTDEAEAAIGRRDALADLDRQGRELREAIADQARVESRFEAAAAALGARLGTEAAGGGAEAVALDLAARLGRAEIDDRLRQGAAERRAVEGAALAEARLAAEAAGCDLAALVAEAKAGSPADLADAERASDEVKGLRDKVLDLDDQLATLAGPVPLDRLRADLEGADPEALAARIEALADRLAPLAAERDALGVQVGRCRQQLEAMDGGPDAADARQGVAERLVRLGADVEQYARLRLASAVLSEAIERHRAKNQGSVLGRAGDLFATLTGGSFAGLRADVDDKNQPILRGIRADGVTPIDVASMSEGTADQLYLALRLASLEVYLDDPRHDPMPLVLDDILVNFDNARSLAALQALARLSDRTQVLFFTHHDHLVDLARAAIDPARLFVHRLDPTLTIAQPPAEPKPKRRKKAGTLFEDP